MDVAAEYPVVDQVSEYLPMFLAEGREHLQELNLAVVRIEETPDDRETVDEIFRIAHSLKLHPLANPTESFWTVDD